MEEHKNHVHISMGDVLRAEIERGSEMADKINETMKQGGCLQFNEFWGLVDKEIKRHVSPELFVFLDGFPRSEQNNSEWWNT